MFNYSLIQLSLQHLKWQMPVNEGLTEKGLCSALAHPQDPSPATRAFLACLIWMTHALFHLNLIYSTLFTLAYLSSLSDNREGGILISIVTFCFIHFTARVLCALWTSSYSSSLTGT